MSSTPADRKGHAFDPERLVTGARKGELVVVAKDGKLARLLGRQMVVGIDLRDPEQPARRALPAAHRVSKRKQPRKPTSGFKPGEARRAEAAEREEDLKTWRLLTEDTTVETDEHAGDEPEETAGVSLPMTTTEQVKRRDDLVAFGEAKLAALQAARS